MASLPDLLAAVLPRVRALRHHLHQHPEPGYGEVETARAVVDALRDIPGIRLRERVGVTGVVATLAADRPGPGVALRADMDALPIGEESGVPWSSRRPGLMHACGHDGHTAALVGAGLVLGQIQDELAGPVKLIFQPAEEGGAGAARMLAEGALADPPVEAIFGFHNLPTAELALDQMVIRPGPLMAAAGEFSILLRGRGGHAAAPERCLDPLLAGARVVEALQTIVAREVRPLSPAVVSVTTFHAGTAHNIIAPTAEIGGTFRSFDQALHGRIATRIREIATATAAAHGVTAEVTVNAGYPVTINHPRATRYLRGVAEALGHGADLVDPFDPLMGGEDFAYFAQAVPATFWFLGARPPEVPEVPFCHHPAYDFNDAILPRAITMHVETARRFARDWAGTPA